MVDLSFHLGHPPGDGLLVTVLVERIGRLETQPAEPQEQLIRRIRLVLDIEQNLHHVTQGRNIPKLAIDAGPGGRQSQNSLEVFLPGAGEFRRVPVPRMPGQHRTHPGVLPVSQPLPDGFRAALDHFSDNTHIDTTRSTQNGFGLHPNQYVIIRAFLPSDQNSGFFWGDLNLHTLIISKARPQIHQNHDFVS